MCQDVVVTNINDWKFLDITIERDKCGLGFSIAGGIDNSHLENNSEIHVTKIINNGAAALNGQLKVNDIIEKVNDISIVGVTHATAVNILKNAGGQVKLSIRRKRHEGEIKEIELQKGQEGFGFSIAGGIGNQHIPGDNGIFITKVMDGGSAYIDGRLKVGHKVIAVRNAFGDRDFRNITHEEAVEALIKSPHSIILSVVEKEDNSQKSTNIHKKICTDEDEFNDSRNCTTDVNMMTKKKFDSSKSSEQMVPPTYSEKQFRTITLQKGTYGLGFNIVGGEDGEGIFVSFILEGGPASIDGNLRKGDKIISVNGIDFTNITHEEAAAILKGEKDSVTIIAEYNEKDYARFDSKLNFLRQCQSEHSLHLGNLLKTNEKKTMHVKALFDYDPNRDDDLPSLGLSFNFGDILHVTNASDDEWWLAKKIFANSNEGFGIIPAKKRWERKQRARDRSVKFEGHMPVLLDKNATSDKRKKNYSFSRKFPFMKNRDEKYDECTDQESFMLCYTQEDNKDQDSGSKEILYRVELPYMDELTLVYLEKDIDDDDNQELLCNEDNIHSYEKVEEIAIDYVRPIIILGPLKDRINDNLISDHPEKFGSCIPHTTRQRREKEIDGRDYYFVESREKMEQDIQNHLFIEAGQYNENLYGTSIEAVKEVAKQGKHCILDVSGNAIRRMYASHLYPIVLFTKLSSPEAIMKMNNKLTLEQARKAYNRAARVEREFLEHFTHIVNGDEYSDIYEQIKQCISRHTKNRVWMLCKYQNET